MSKFNSLKLSVLKTVKKHGFIDSKTLAGVLNISVPNAQMCLLKCFKQKLLGRTTGGTALFNKRPFVYSINDRGVARLAYLEAQSSP